MPYRLIPIFILNFKIEDDICDLMIKTRQIKTGIFTEKETDKKNDFIDHLSYELYVVQLPYLQAFENHDFSHDEYRQKLFSLLKLFDQNAKKTNNEYRLRLFRRIFPGFLDRVIKRLQTADSDNPDLEKQMQAEDYYLKPLVQRDNKIAWFVLNKKEMETKLKDAKKVIKDEKSKAKQALEALKDEKSKAKQALEDEKSKAKQALEDEKSKAKQALEDEKSKAKQLLFELAKMLKESGVPTEVIRQKTNLTIGEIEKL
jgi:flagellar biosynthesis GTPase FlhF